MTAMTEERPIFENEEWLVTEGGLEHRTTGYFIGRESLGNRRDDGLWAWPLHMAEKSWCKMTSFAEAFSCAATVYGLETGADLAQTFKIARSEISAWPSRNKKVLNPAPLMSRTLRMEVSDPISWKPGSAKKSLETQGFQSPDYGSRMRSRTEMRPMAIKARFHFSQQAVVRTATSPWQASHRFRKTGTKLVRLIQAAWNIR